MPDPIRFSKILGLKFGETLKGHVRSKSQKLFAGLGLMKINGGMVNVSPFLMKSLRKLERLAHRKMSEVGALEIQMPSMTDGRLFKLSDRKEMKDLFELNDGNKKYYLNPTCEELAAYLLSSAVEFTHRQLPCRVYQITNKFRDEKRYKSGLLRAREFTMKDLYCFDADADASQLTYTEVKKKYHEFFQDIGVPYVCVKGNSDDIGGIESHEFHYLSEVGDDKLLLCQGCGYKANLQLHRKKESQTCPICDGKNTQVASGIEVGHIFNLGTLYTLPFGASYLSYEGQKEYLHMSSYGLGLSRILGAAIEILSLNDEIRWPMSIAPYLLCILQPKDGSMEVDVAARLTETIIHNLNDSIGEDILIDDRVNLTYVKRMKMIQNLGIPFAVVMGKEVCDEYPVLDVHDVNRGVVDRIPVQDVVPFLRHKLLGTPLTTNLLERENV